MMNAGNLNGKARQMKDWRRRLVALVAALSLLISSCGLTAFAESDDDIYSAPVTAPIAPSNASPEPEETAEATPAPEDREETGTEPGEESGEVASEKTGEEKTGEETGTESGEEAGIENKTEAGTETEGETEGTGETEQEDLTIYEPGSLAAEADGITVALDYNAEARIPAETVFTLTRTAGGDLYTAMKSAARVLKEEQDEIWKREMSDEAVFYTLTLTDPEGNEVHPAAGVTLTCSNLVIPEGATGFVTGENEENLDWNGDLTLDFLPDAIGYAVLNQVQIGTITLVHEDIDYIVTAAYGPEAGFPFGTELRVREIMPGTPEYMLYSGMTDEALNEEWSEITLERYFDIAFVKDEVELEPQAEVDVQITFHDKIEENEETEVQAVHIENNEATVIEAETDSNAAARHDDEAIDTVSFTSDSFSVYGVVQKKKIITKILDAQGHTYEIEVTYTQEAEIPEDAQVKVEEIPEGSDLWEAYRLQTAAALNADDVRLPGLYDISIVDAEGNKVEPKAAVNVTFKLLNDDTTEDIQVVHFKEEIPQELVEAAAQTQGSAEQTEVQIEPLAEEDKIASEEIQASVEGDAVTFNTDSFSVYAFAYTIVTYYKVASGETYRITLNYDENSGIPAGSTLQVNEILPGNELYNEYLEKALLGTVSEQTAALNEAIAANSDEAESGTTEIVSVEPEITEDQYARFFDIEIWNNNQKIEPNGNVSVTIELADAPADKLNEMLVVHFTGEEPVIIDAAIDSSSIQFETDSFSVYGVLTIPSGQITSLAGIAFTISRRNGYYLTKEITNGVNETHKFIKTTNKDNATVWISEATGQSNEYNIFTYDEDGKKVYLNLKQRSENTDNAHATLSETPQAFTVIDRWYGRYALKTTDNGSEYFLNEYAGENGFAGWHYADSNYDALVINIQPMTQTVNETYAVIVKYDGNYYSVKPDGTLQPAEYYPESNTVKMEYPLVWKLGRLNPGSNNNNDPGPWYTLRIETEGKTFNGPGGIADSYTYRYLCANEPNGLIGETENDTNAWWAAFKLDGNKFRGCGDTKGNYLGVTEENGKLKIVGKQRLDQVGNVEVYLAKVTDIMVPDALAKYHSVTHIDISIHGSAMIEYPLPRGTYYKANGDVVVVSKSNPKTVTVTQEVPIEKEDIKNATITATNKAGEKVDNAFYVTGYSGNKYTGPDKPTQIRIEGSFIVSDHVPTEYQASWTGAENDIYYSTLKDNPTHQKIRKERKESQITYKVSTTKMVEFTLKDGDQTLYYDAAKQEPVKVTVPVTLSGSCGYWDDKNVCPGAGKDANGPREAWRDGCIVGDGGQASSGIDFTLGGSTKQDPEAYPSIDITKYIVDEDGEVIAIPTQLTNTFQIYQYNNTKDKSSVVVDPNGTPSPYSKIGTLNVPVVNGMGKNNYDLDITSAMVYIEEDKSSVLPTIEISKDEELTYVKTIIETERVRRGASVSGENYSKEWSDLADIAVHYTSEPEVVGKYKVDSTDYNEAVLNFYVYNVYRRKAAITVEKDWEDAAGLPLGDDEHMNSIEVTLKKANGETVLRDDNPKTLNKDNKWTYEWTDLLGSTTYYVEETYNLSDPEWEGFAAPEYSNGSTPIQEGSIQITNRKNSLHVKLRKYEKTSNPSDTSIAIEGAEFEIYDEAGWSSTPQVALTNIKNSSTTFVTDNKGIFYDGYLPIGTYYIVETKAPAGYARITEPIVCELITPEVAEGSGRAGRLLRYRIGESGSGWDNDWQADENNIFNLYIPNEKSTSITVEKLWSDGAPNHVNDKVKVKLFKDTGVAVGTGSQTTPATVTVKLKVTEWLYKNGTTLSTPPTNGWIWAAIQDPKDGYKAVDNQNEAGTPNLDNNNGWEKTYTFDSADPNKAYWMAIGSYAVSGDDSKGTIELVEGNRQYFDGNEGTVTINVRVKLNENAPAPSPLSANATISIETHIQDDLKPLIRLTIQDSANQNNGKKDIQADYFNGAQLPTSLELGNNEAIERLYVKCTTERMPEGYRTKLSSEYGNATASGDGFLLPAGSTKLIISIEKNSSLVTVRNEKRANKFTLLDLFIGSAEADTTETPIPLPGVEYLPSTATEVIDSEIELSSANNWTYTWENLPKTEKVGSEEKIVRYYVVETSSTVETIESTTYEITQYHLDDTDTADEDESERIKKVDITNTVPNKPTTGHLSVSKTVGGNAGNTSKDFTFTVTVTGLSNPGPYNTVKNSGGTITNGTITFNGSGQATFTLKHNETLTIKDLPENKPYSVVESAEGGYEIGTDGNTSGNIVAGSTVNETFTNTLNTYGDLKISKTVSGLDADEEKEFEFTITLPNYSSDKVDVVKTDGTTTTTEEKTLSDKEITITLKHGESATIQHLPNNTQYSIVETDYSGDHYTPNLVSGELTGTIVGGTSSIVEVSVDNVHTVGDLKIEKTVVATEPDTTKEFHFTVTLNGHIGTETFSAVKNDGTNNTDVDVTFTDGVSEDISLKHNESLLIKDLPDGTDYTVVEKEADLNGYTTTSEVTSSIAAETTHGIISSGETETVTYTNTKYATVNVIASKAWTGLDVLKPNAVRFELYTVEGAPGEEVYTKVPSNSVRANPQVIVGNAGWTNTAEWDDLPKYLDDTANEADKVAVRYVVKETGVYFGDLDDGKVPDDAEWVLNLTEYYDFSDEEVTVNQETNVGSVVISNQPKTTEIVVNKTWSPEFTDEKYTWAATFVLKSDVSNDQPIEGFKLKSDLAGAAGHNDITISNSSSQYEKTIVDLPIYALDANNAPKRITYTVEETGFTVKYEGQPVLVVENGEKVSGTGSLYTPTVYTTIEGDGTQTISVTNTQESDRLIVRKKWLDVLDPDTMPTVKFRLMYYFTDDAGSVAGKNFWHDYKIGETNEFELSATTNPKWEWKCPEELPTKIDNKTVRYFVQEVRNDMSNSGDGDQSVYYDVSGLGMAQQPFVIHVDGYESSQNHFSGTWQQPYGAYIEGSSGTITIRNRCPNEYMQIDIKKKILEYRNGNELWTTTSEESRMKGLVMKIQIYRRIVRSDDNTPNSMTFTSKYADGPLTDWEKYGQWMLIGYEPNGQGIAINPNDPELFKIRYSGSESAWHWTIGNKEQNTGLPRNGFYTKGDTTYPVRYQYLVVEENAYTDSSMKTPLNFLAVTPAAWDGCGEGVGCQFYVHEPTVAQDQDRLVNQPATDLKITKTWNISHPENLKVYVKVSRTANGDYNSSYIENFADHLNKTADKWLKDKGFAQGLANYTDATVEIVHDVKCFVLQGNQTITISNVEVGSLGSPKGQYRYWVEELGYVDSNGVEHWFATQTSDITTNYSVSNSDNITTLANHNHALDNASDVIFLGGVGENQFTITNTIDTVNAKPAISKKLNGGAFTGLDSTGTEKTFSFKLTQISPVVATGQSAYTDTVTSGKDGTITFKDIEYTGIGTYIYEIVEIGTDDDIMDYDGKTIYAKIEITKPDSTLVASTPTYYTDAGCTTPVTGDAAFNNIELGELDLTKSVAVATGSELPEGADEQTFTFKIVLTAPTNGTLPTSVPVTIGADTSNHTITTESGISSITVTLKKDQTAVVKKLPVGTGYTITETNVPGYTLNWSEGKKSGTISRTPSVEEAINTFTSVPYTPVAEKMLNGVAFNGKLGDGTTGTSFKFTLIQINKDGTVVDDGYKQENVETNGEGAITFAEIKYNTAGTYYYMITEQGVDTDTMDYDTDPVYLRVTVDPILETATGEYFRELWTGTPGEKAVFHNTELTKIKVTKTWNGKTADWPEGYTVEMTLMDGSDIISTTVEKNGEINPAVLTSAKRTATWSNLPKYKLVDSTLTEIVYTVSETKILYNSTEISNINNVFDISVTPTETPYLNGEVVINNTPKTTERHAKKEWVDNNNAKGLRPGSITFTLSATYKDDNGENATLDYSNYGITPEQQITMTDNTWPDADWTELPVYTKDGRLITYDVSESTVKYYKLTDKSELDASQTWTITNTLNEVSLKIIKDDANGGKQLSGATFELKRKVGSEYLPVTDNSVTGVNGEGKFTVDSNGEITLTGITDGEYQIVESEAPAGYLMYTGEINFTVANGSIDDPTVDGTVIRYSPKTDAAGSVATFKVANTAGVELPATGGSGTLIYTVAGMALIVLAGVLLVSRRKRKA